jgi:hypothetical protein
MADALLASLSSEEFNSLHVHWERLVALGYALRRLGVLGLTEFGIRRLAAGK